MNPLIVLAGTLAGLGVFAMVAQLIPGGQRLDAALARIHAAGAEDPPLFGVRRSLGLLPSALP